MKKIISLFISIILSYCSLFAQITFSKTVDIDKDVDLGWQAIEIKDGYIIGVSSTCNNNDYICAGLIRIDFKGNVIWKKSLKHTRFRGTYFMQVVNDSIFLCSPTRNYNLEKENQIQIYSMKGDSIGAFNFGTTLEEEMYGLFKADDDNKFTLLGWSYKPNSNAHSLRMNYISQDWKAHSWKTIPNTLGYGAFNMGNQDSSYLIGINKCSNLKCSSCALKLDKNFNKISEKCSTDLSFTNNAVISPTQNGYVLAHIVEHPNPFPKDSTVDLPSISSFDKNGNFLWKYFFRSHRYKEHVNIITAKNGDIIGVGQSEENSLKGDDYYGGGWIYRISPTGKLKWEKSIYDQTTPTIIGNLGVFYNVTETSDGGLLLVGFASDTFPNFKPSINNIDTWIVKLDSSGCLKPNCGYEQQVASKDIFSYFEPIKTSVYPNPASKDLFFKIQDIDYLKGNIVFYDLNGRKITQFNLFEDQEEHRLDVSHIQNGVYLWQLILDDKVRQSGKVVVLKE